MVYFTLIILYFCANANSSVKVKKPGWKTIPESNSDLLIINMSVNNQQVTVTFKIYPLNAVSPIKNSSTFLAACRPSFIAHTTRD